VRSPTSKKPCRSLSRKSLSMVAPGIVGSGTARSGGSYSKTGRPGLATNRSTPAKATLPASVLIAKADDPAERSQPPSRTGPQPRPRKEALEQKGRQAGSAEAVVEAYARNSLNRTALALQGKEEPAQNGQTPCEPGPPQPTAVVPAEGALSATGPLGAIGGPSARGASGPGEPATVEVARRPQGPVTRQRSARSA
jgi:hypothetical protein